MRVYNIEWSAYNMVENALDPQILGKPVSCPRGFTTSSGLMKVPAKSEEAALDIAQRAISWKVNPVMGKVKWVR